MTTTCTRCSEPWHDNQHQCNVLALANAHQEIERLLLLLYGKPQQDHFALHVSGRIAGDRCEDVVMRVVGVEFTRGNHAEIIGLIRHCADNIEGHGELIELPDRAAVLQ